MRTTGGVRAGMVGATAVGEGAAAGRAVAAAAAGRAAVAAAAGSVTAGTG